MAETKSAYGSARRTALSTALTALRGVVMIVAGLFALAYPGEAVRFAILVGGGILLLDGILNLAALNGGQGRGVHFWSGLLRSMSAILAGLMIIFSAWLLSLLSVELLRWLIGLQAIVVGAVEALTPLLTRAAPRPAPAPSAWGYATSGGAYALFGLAVLLVPPAAAVMLARIVAALMIVHAVSLLVRSWRGRSLSAV